MNRVQEPNPLSSGTNLFWVIFWTVLLEGLTNGFKRVSICFWNNSWNCWAVKIKTCFWRQIFAFFPQICKMSSFVSTSTGYVGISPLCHGFLPQTDGHFRLPILTTELPLCLPWTPQGNQRKPKSRYLRNEFFSSTILKDVLFSERRNKTWEFLGKTWFVLFCFGVLFCKYLQGLVFFQSTTFEQFEGPDFWRRHDETSLSADLCIPYL